jgi:hypothetical protein
MKPTLARSCLTNSSVARRFRLTADGQPPSLPSAAIGRPTRQGRAALALVLVLTTANALAVNANDYLFLPTVTQGEREIDLYGGTGSSGVNTRAESNAALGFGVGVTQHWFTELDIEYRWQSPVGTGLDAFAWENTFQIGEPGQWPVDIGMVCNVEKPYEASRNSLQTEGLSIQFGPLLQKDIGKFQVNFNLLFTRFLQSSEFSATQLSYQSQIKYRYSQPLEVGLQAFGRFSSHAQTWAPYSEQVHRVGPVLLGRLAMPRERALSYNIGFLFGTTAHSPDTTLRFQFEYEF